MTEWANPSSNVPLRTRTPTPFLVYYMDRPEFVEIIRVWDAAQGLQALIETTD